MASENPTWGAPRIHGELLKLGFKISERTVSRYLARLHRRDGAAQLWRTFLNNHREVLAGMDFFTVITANFRILYYYHADRTHVGLAKDTPQGRLPSNRNPGQRLLSLPRLGGLHHRYCWEKAA
jgi:hypothetical protein